MAPVGSSRSAADRAGVPSDIVPRETVPPGVVPQRLCLVLPSTGEFDSRTYRIASAAAARGHDVTVIARLGPGLPTLELHPGGYTILRVLCVPIEGLPFPRAVRAIRVAVRRLYAWRTGTPYRPPDLPGQGLAPSVGPASGRAPGDGAPAQGPSAQRSDAGTPVSPVRGGPGRTGARASAVRRMTARIMRRLSIQLTIRAQARFARTIAPPADLYHGMAYMGIPVALSLAGRHRACVVYDARDIYLDAANLARLRGPMRWVIARSERRWARASDRVITVNRPYAEVLRDRFGVPEPLIIQNCSYQFDPPDPRPRRFHDRLGLDPATSVVLYQGGFSHDRGIEQLVDAMELLEGASLVLLGYGVLAEQLRGIAGRSDGRVHVLDAVPPAELLLWVASADVVAMPIQPTTLNHRLTTPNKLFEAMAAGVPIVASDLPGMAPYLSEIGCGATCDPTSPESIAGAIRSILDLPPAERAAMAGRARAAAHGRYNWETEVARLFDEYGRLTGLRW